MGKKWESIAVLFVLFVAVIYCVVYMGSARLPGKFLQHIPGMLGNSEITNPLFIPDKVWFKDRVAYSQSTGKMPLPSFLPNEYEPILTAINKFYPGVNSLGNASCITIFNKSDGVSDDSHIKVSVDYRDIPYPRVFSGEFYGKTPTEIALEIKAGFSSARSN